MAEDLKECPQCAEHVKLRALLCRFCGYKFKSEDIIRQSPVVTKEPEPVKEKEEVKEEEFAFEEPKKKSGKKIFFFLFIFLVLGVGAWLGVKYGYHELLYDKITGGKYVVDDRYVESSSPFQMREGRIALSMLNRGAAERGDNARKDNQPDRDTYKSETRVTETSSHKVAQDHFDVQSLERIARDTPENTQNYYNLGTAYLLNAQPAEAIDHLITAVTLLPEDYEALSNLAMAYYQSKQYEQAIAKAKLALGFMENNMLALNILSLSHLKKDQSAHAIKYVQQAIKADPNHSDSHVNLGTIYLEQGKQDKAKEKFKEALSIDDANSAAYCNLASINYKAGLKQEALGLWQKALANAKNIDDTRAELIKHNIEAVKRKEKLTKFTL